MNKNKRYRQCKLVNGSRETISWVEERLAIKGNVISVEREPGWVIRDVSSFGLAGSLVETLRDQERHQRGQSDI